MTRLLYLRFPDWSLVTTMLAVLTAAAAPRDAKPAPLAQPLATGGEWSVANASAVGAAQAGKAPTVLRWADAPGGSYVLTGEILLPSANSSASISAAPRPVTDSRGRVTQPPAVSAVVAAKGDDAVELRIGRTAQPLLSGVDRATTWVPFALYRTNDYLQVVVAGQVASTGSAPTDSRDVALSLNNGAQVRQVAVNALRLANDRLVPMVLDGKVNTRFAGENAQLSGGIRLDPATLPAGPTALDSVPFLFPPVGSGCDVSPSMSGIAEGIRVKSIYNSPTQETTNGRLVLKLPEGPFSALHVVAFSRQAEGTVPRMTVRCGLGGYSAIFADTVVEVPDIASGEGGAMVESRLPVTLADGTAGFLYRLRIPLADTGQLWMAPRLVNTLEFTRDVRVHLNLPDPNEFTWLPAGPPSGVVVLAATLERSPVIVNHEPVEPGNIFHEGQTAEFRLSLTNREARGNRYRVTARIAGPGTPEDSPLPVAEWVVQQDVSLDPNATGEALLDVTPRDGRRGWYRCTLEVSLGSTVLQRRETSFAVLVPDTRQARADSPFGIWCFFGSHNAAGRADLRDYLGSIMRKGGWRWTYGGSPSGGRGATTEDYRILQEKYLVTHNIQSPPQAYQRGAGWYDEAGFKEQVVPWLAKATENGFDRSWKVLHESRSSTAILRRFSEYLGGEAYAMPADEKAKLDTQFARVVEYCRALKQADPTARIVLINDYPGVGVEYMKRGFPKELFDVFGSEGANFFREPERQPDWLSLHAIQQQWHRAKAQYGYEDKPVWYTEALYHGTNPGNLTLHDQGVIAVREAMLGLANGVERFAAMGCVKDSSDDYRWSHWGEVGYCYRLPEANPKPSYAMFAWLTQILDQATFVDDVETGSTVVHLLHFRRADGTDVYPLWVVRGRQQVSLQVTGQPTVYDVFGNVVPVPAADGVLKLSVTNSPLYLTGATVAAMTDRQPEPAEAPMTALVDLAQPGAVTPVAGASAVLEASWDFPRLRGTFAVEPAQIDGRSALRVAMQPDDDARKLLQRYLELKLATPLVLPGRPESLLVNVKGNGGWGRVMFEIVDAKGRVWTSCGNQYEGSSNSSDNKGDSYLSFEGWRTIRFPVVGQYDSPDQFVAFPGNHNWWPTNHPELTALEQAHAEAVAAYPGKLTAYEAEMKAYETAKAAYDQAVAEKRKDVPKPGAAPVRPREPVLRNYGIAPVDYPLTLTKVIVAMPPNLIYVNREVPVADPTIYLEKLGVE